MDKQKEDSRIKGISLLIRDLKENGLGLLAVGIYIVLLQHLFHTICPMQLLFGLPCPGCGLTRSGLLFLSGHPVKAFFMHPFLYAWILIALDFLINRYLLGRKGKELYWLLGITLFGMLVFYIYRMVVYYPDGEPMQPLTEGIFTKIRQLFYTHL